VGEQEQQKKRPWIGGYAIRDSRGRDLYFIRKQINGRRYDVTTGDLTLRLAASGEVLAPFRSPSEVVNPGATYVGDIVFDVPPQIRTATLRATLGSREKEQELTLKAGS
jgi:hypothetical protein